MKQDRLVPKPITELGRRHCNELRAEYPVESSWYDPNKKRTFIVALSLGLLLAATSFAEMRPVLKLRAGVPPYKVIAEILANNQRAVPKKPQAEKNRRTTPFITWLADSDSRVHADLLLAEPGDKIYAVRNIANQLELSAGAVDYGIRHLHSPVLLITGNTGSDAIRTMMEGYSGMEPSLRRDMDRLRIPPVKQGGKDGKAKIPFADRWLMYVERNVDHQVEAAMKRYADRIKSGRLVVVGGVIDLLNQYGHGNNRLVIINLNGETRAVEIRTSPHLVRVDPALLAIVGRAHSNTAGK